MTLRAIRVDEPNWEAASPTRRAEWRALIADLLRTDPPWPDRAGSVLVVAADDDALHLRFENGEVTEATVVPRAELRAVLDEYLGVIDRLAEEDLHPMRMEALDMAKRVVHDGGARRLGELLPDLSPSLEARRRLFSLVVALLADTTRRVRAHRHL